MPDVRTIAQGKSPANIMAALFFHLVFCPIGIAQINYTPGDTIGEDHTVFLFAPCRHEADRGEDAYEAYVNQPLSDISGQKYNFVDYVDDGMPGTSPGLCTVTRIHDIIGNQTDDIGVLLITGHGDTMAFTVEVYDSNEAGRAAMMQAFHAYVDTDGTGPDQGLYRPWHIGYGETSTGWNILGISKYFIRDFGQLAQSLVYIATCSGNYLADDLVAKGARVAVGNSDHPTSVIQRERVTTFFRRMDGHEGRESRPVSAARQSPPQSMNNLLFAGEGNTVLTVAVENVTYPTPCRYGDTISITFDAKCNTCTWPEVWSEWYAFCGVGWSDDSLTFKAVLCDSPWWEEDIEVTLGWDHVWSARNWACLDGNTKPPGGNNAEGPAHDDYVRTMAVDPCYAATKAT